MHQPNGFSVIDSHQHIWSLDKGFYTWLTPELGSIYRDFTLEDYQQDVSGLSDVISVTGSILVQAAAVDDETDFMLSVAENNQLIAGVVGWVDFEGDSLQVCRRLEALACHPKFKGVRPMIQDYENPEWILNPDFVPVFEQLVQLGLSFDALCRSEHLPSILSLAQQYPELSIVIDHAAKPNISVGEFESWSCRISAFKYSPNVCVKFSGLTLEANETQQEHRHFMPYFRQLHQVFGVERMMWGSDWPVVNINSSYSKWLTLSKQLVEEWDTADKARFWSGTARTFYQIGN